MADLRACCLEFLDLGCMDFLSSVMLVVVQETVVDLLLVLGRRASLPIALCCSARDSLDAVCARVSASQQFSLLFLVWRSTPP